MNQYSDDYLTFVYAADAAQQLIQPDPAIACLSSLSAAIMLKASCAGRVNSGVRRLNFPTEVTLSQSERAKASATLDGHVVRAPEQLIAADRE